MTGKQTVQQGMRALEVQHCGAYPAPTMHVSMAAVRRAAAVQRIAMDSRGISVAKRKKKTAVEKRTKKTRKDE